MLWLKALFGKLNLWWLPYVAVFALLLATMSAGAWINGWRWDARMKARELEVQAGLLTAEKRLNDEWVKVGQLQAEYTKLNKETYDDLRTKLDALSASVVSYGTRTVRVCAARPLVVSSTKDGVPATTPRTDAAAGDGRGGAVEPDPRPSWSSEGYDIFPEVTALMARADEQAITCNQHITWEEKRP